MKNLLWGLLFVLVACVPPNSNPIAKIWPLTEAETPLPTDSELLIPPPSPLAFSLVFPSTANDPFWEALDLPPVLASDVEVDLTGLETLEMITNPMPYHGDLVIETHPRIEKLVARYSGGGKRYFRQWMERSGRYLPMMQQIFAEEGLPMDLTYLAMIESGFNEKAYSWARAAGPWQFIESTGRMYGLQNNFWMDERRDPEKASRAAAKMLKRLHKMFDGDWLLAAAAYNAGPGKVRRAVRKTGKADFWAIIETKHLQEETKNYVPKLMAALHIARNPSKYGFNDLELHDPLQYDKVTVATTTDLDVVATLSGVPYKTIKRLNSELKRWCTPPDRKDYQIRVPYGQGEAFKAAYLAMPESARANYKHHRIKKGENLGSIAKKYNVRLKDVVSLNRIKNPRALKIGQDLILPLSKKFNRLPMDEMKDDYLRSRRRTHTVRKGDSLWTIARRYDVTEKQLRVWNRLGWSNHLRLGQKLAVSKKGVVKKRRSSKKVAKGPSRKIIYKVQAGDSLWSIGRQFQVKMAQIRNWNNLSNGHVLRPGQKLKLMVRGASRS